MRNRIVRLESENTLFLLDKERGEYWADVKQALDQASSQEDYLRLLEFENRDLQIRELKHRCYNLFRQTLSEHPGLAEKSYNPTEAFLDFCDEKRKELDSHLEWNVEGKDRIELQLLERMEQDIKQRGPDSIYLKEILGFPGDG